MGPVTGLFVSFDGSLGASISTEKAVKIFDVLNFDLTLMLRLPFQPKCAEWISKKEEGQPRIALSDSESSNIFVYDIHESTKEPVHTFSPHSNPITLLKYNPIYNIVISVDTKGATL